MEWSAERVDPVLKPADDGALLTFILHPLMCHGFFFERFLSQTRRVLLIKRQGAVTA